VLFCCYDAAVLLLLLHGRNFLNLTCPHSFHFILFHLSTVHSFRLIRNSAYSLEFLDEWWNMKQYVKPVGLAKSGDNDAFKAMLAKLPEFDQHILVPPRCTFNSFAYFIPEERLETIMAQPEGAEGSLEKQEWYLNDAFYHRGDLLAHVAGYNNKEQPVGMLLEIAE
jgi:hypothetical protein